MHPVFTTHLSKHVCCNITSYSWNETLAHTSLICCSWKLNYSLTLKIEYFSISLSKMLLIPRFYLIPYWKMLATAPFIHIITPENPQVTAFQSPIKLLNSWPWPYGMKYYLTRISRLHCHIKCYYIPSW